ncbi:sulfate/molybdate ABC transporter ATP-binding protein [Selenomonas sp. TAMA-11512]|uniref:sulfate/molybdate ABC transporter ATP-binding protein n=1 Tax=Selenomonas sp. TAMA-11512 TaxID=3095337 RepID=UPI0030864409|nr:sulfate/molybdate ABC transporter ATP-binding protein [Selenomonas sp. TAMA-11512]
MKLLVDIEKKLRNFSLRVAFEADREVLSLLGASGCGKSMTLKCIAGIETPDRGRIVLGDIVLYDSEKRINLPPQERHVGYLFQNYALFPHMTLAENIRFVIRGDKKKKEQIVREEIARFSLDGLEDAYPVALSGGQQQRAAFARMLATRPKLLMLDEPFSALDSYLRWNLERELKKIIEDYGATALLVSHDRGEAYRLSDRIAVIEKGHIEAIRAKEELFQHPETLAATLLTGCKNISKARKVNDGLLIATDWGIELESEDIPDGLQYVAIRAHYFELAEEGASDAIPFRVEEVIEDTFSTILMLAAEKGVGTRSLVRWEFDKGEKTYGIGDIVPLRLPREKMILLTR